MSSSQLTNSIIFQRSRVLTTNQLFVFFALWGVLHFLCQLPKFGSWFFNGDGNPWHCPGGASAARQTGQRQPWNPVVKWRCYFWKWMLRHGTMQHFLCQFGTAISTSFFKSLRFRWNFSEEFYFLSMPPEPEKLEIVSNVHSMSITFRYFFGQSYVAWCTYFQHFFNLFSSRFGMMIS